jgi:hypothetical protein
MLAFMFIPFLVASKGSRSESFTHSSLHKQDEVIGGESDREVTDDEEIEDFVSSREHFIPDPNQPNVVYEYQGDKFREDDDGDVGKGLMAEKRYNSFRNRLNWFSKPVKFK